MVLLGYEYPRGLGALALPGCCWRVFGGGCRSECEGGMDLGDGGPDGGAFLAVALAEVFACLRREFLGLAVVV